MQKGSNNKGEQIHVIAYCSPYLEFVSIVGALMMQSYILLFFLCT